jgi:signal transduction histidine kinase
METMMGSNDNNDERIQELIEATKNLSKGDYDVQIPVGAPDSVGQLGQSLVILAHTLEMRRIELQKLDEITSHINSGVLLDDILESVYVSFKEIIPYDRIGFALIDHNEQTVRARWAKSEQSDVSLNVGYSAKLEGSSLQTIIDTKEPRIINDLAAYLEQKPESDSTNLIVSEGVRSSLTCPLITNGFPVGFVFFSSKEPNTYREIHVDLFQRISRQLSVIVDKGHLITELSEHKAEIEQQNQKLREINELKNTFLGTVAHDLRNPIGLIQSMIQLIRDPLFELSKEEVTTFQDDMLQQTQHMLGLIDELLDVSKIESGKLELRLEEIDTREFLQNSVARHTKLAIPKKTKVVLKAIDDGQLIADSARLRQVIDNLISNAVKFSPPQSTVWVSGVQDDGGWKIEVCDQGPGIKPKDRERLFQDFARLSARPTAGESSTGLGLAITRRFVEAHNGKIGVDSEFGHGATFWLWLPKG